MPTTFGVTIICGVRYAKHAKCDCPVEDPIQLDVNWVKLTLNFEYDEDANKVCYLSGECRSQWLEKTGWERDEDYATCEWSYSHNQSRVSIVASERFTNSEFCKRAPTGGPGADHCYHDDVTATGYSHGYCSGDGDVTISGPCDHLLDDEFVVTWWW